MHKKILRVISIIFAIIFCINTQATYVFAEELANDKMTVKVQSVSGQPGETVQVKIDISNNPGIASMKFNVINVYEYTCFGSCLYR